MESESSKDDWLPVFDKTFIYCLVKSFGLAYQLNLYTSYEKVNEQIQEMRQLPAFSSHGEKMLLPSLICLHHEKQSCDFPS